MDMDDHFGIWTDSIQAVFVQNRYAGLLTSLHCSDLYEKRLRFLADPPPARSRIHAFLEERRAWEKQTIAALSSHPRYALAIEEQDLLCNLRLLQVWIICRWLVCMRPVHEQTLEDVRSAAASACCCGLRAMARAYARPFRWKIETAIARSLPACRSTATALRHALDGVPTSR